MTSSCRLPFVLLLVLIGALPLIACSAPNSPSLSTEDEQQIRALEQAYVDAWLRDDTAAILATLSPDVVLMPGGSHPLVGLDAAREFWWPNDGSRTTITSYTTTIDEIGGNAFLAYLRGTGVLSFIYERDTLRIEQSSRNMTLTIVRKETGNAWRITRRMWAPLGQ